MGSRFAAIAAVLLLAACGGEDNRPSAESPLPDDFQTTQPLPNQQLTLSEEDAARPLSAPERAWLRRLRDVIVELSGAAARVEVVHVERAVAEKIMDGDEATARPVRAAADALGTCTQRLRKLGEPPTARMQVGARALERTCKTLERTARETKDFLAKQDPAGLHAGDVDLQLARGDLDAAIMVLLPRSEGRELKSIDEPSGESRIQPRYGAAATALLGWGVEVRCWSKEDWEKAKVDAEQLSGENVSDRVAGYVLSGSRANLAPDVCTALDSFAYGRERPTSGDAFVELVDALVILAHESQHAAGIVDEAAAECYGVQQARDAAVELGATKAYAQRIAAAAWEDRYPALPALYRSPECRDGGALDLFPGSAVWP